MYVVIFRAKARALDEEYFEAAKLLREAALTQFNCVAFEAVTEGASEIALSYWHSEADILAWKQYIPHLAAQKAGLARWYESYSVDVAKIERSYTST
jgi:heme-degrading monooxygenase HmoA